MQPPQDGRNGYGYLVTALGATVALLCLVMGFRLLSQDPPRELGVWLAQPPVRDGLALALGGAFLVFLVGVALMVAIRRQFDSPRRKLGRGSIPPDPTGLLAGLDSIDSAAILAERELARWLEAQDHPPASRLELQDAAQRLRETVQEAERILAGIEAAARDADAPADPES